VRHIFKFFLVLAIILAFPVATSWAQSNNVQVERAKALKAYEQYGAVDGSSFAKALENKKIIGYHIFFKGNNNANDAKTRQSVINKYTSGRFSQYKDSSRSRSSSVRRESTIQPYSFRNQLNGSVSKKSNSSSNRFSGSRYKNMDSNRGYSLSVSPEQVQASRAKALELANQQRDSRN